MIKGGIIFKTTRNILKIFLKITFPIKLMEEGRRDTESEIIVGLSYKPYIL